MSIRQLERELAYSAARSDIETCCVRSERDGKKGYWYDTFNVADEDEDVIAKAVTYLEGRNLLERDDKWFVRIKSRRDD